MAKEYSAELIEIRCYCSKCGKIFDYKKHEVVFDGWEQDHHGGSSMIFTCKGCNTYYHITLSKY
ncbi:hypothetical protein LCGC14_2826920 [marine sediment metagenome]|uniref:Uncharacterized protein n=1 Tax=marine sediment metagenome TaxID=412755 RepID=A0A0F8YF87_9ZZZZ